MAFFYNDLSAECAVAIEALDVAFECWVGVVDKVGVKGFGGSTDGDGFVHGTVGEAGGRSEVGGMAAKEPKMGIGIVAAVAHPAAEKEVATTEKIGIGGGVTGEELVNLHLKFGSQGLVGVEGENPGAGATFDGEVFLSGKALPGFKEELGFVGGGDFEGTIRGAGVDDDDFVGELNASEGASEIRLFVERDDGNGQLRRHDGYPILRGTEQFVAGCLFV